MTRNEALAAAAVFRVEMEAVLLEIFHHSIPTLSESVFRNKRKDIPLMIMPFWETTQLHTSHHKIPLHINNNSRNRHQSQKARISDIQHLHSNITVRNVGTHSNYKNNQQPQLGKGHLWESINGSHHFHKESHLPPVFEAEETEQAFHQGTGDESIFVEKLPGSEDSQQDPDEEFNNWRPPFGDPEDPDDEDDNGPPRGGGAPHNPGNNGGGWHPRRPAGGHGFPGGGPPVKDPLEVDRQEDHLEDIIIITPEIQDNTRMTVSNLKRKSKYLKYLNGTVTLIKFLNG